MTDQKRPAVKLDEKITTSIDVDAKFCLWFAWGPEGEPGPQGETVNSVYRPREIDVEGISKVRVTAKPTDEWWHHPGKTSNAAGIDVTRGLEDPAYRDARYNSENIEPLTARLNLLVGMLGPAPDTPPTSTVHQIEIGLGEEISIDNVNDTRLYLGFHDGRHWTNNGGSVGVTVEIVEQRT